MNNHHFGFPVLTADARFLIRCHRSIDNHTSLPKIFLYWYIVIGTFIEVINRCFFSPHYLWRRRNTDAMFYHFPGHGLCSRHFQRPQNDLGGQWPWRPFHQSRMLRTPSDLVFNTSKHRRWDIWNFHASMLKQKIPVLSAVTIYLCLPVSSYLFVSSELCSLSHITHKI